MLVTSLTIHHNPIDPDLLQFSIIDSEKNPVTNIQIIKIFLLKTKVISQE